MLLTEIILCMQLATLVASVSMLWYLLTNNKFCITILGIALIAVQIFPFFAQRV